MSRYADTSNYTTEEISLWNLLIQNQHRTYHTAKNLPFTYEIKRLRPPVKLRSRNGGEDGEPEGKLEPDKQECEDNSDRWGNELFITRKQKSITRATVNMAYRRAVEMGCVVSGPKKLGVYGASYLFSIFIELGIIKTAPVEHH